VFAVQSRAHRAEKPRRTGVAMTAIEITRAGPEDAEQLKQIAISSKSHWRYPEHLIAQWARTPIITPQAIETDQVYLSILNWKPTRTPGPFYVKMGCRKIGESISEWGRPVPCMRYDL